MELRKHITKPMRYREESTQPKKEPHKPFKVCEPSPSNPDIRPACFPTLDLDQDYCDDSNSHLANRPPQQPERPALVFRDPRVKRDMNGNMMADPEEIFGPLLKSRWGLDPVEDLEPGEYDGADMQWVDEDGKDLPRFPLPAFTSNGEWEQLSEGMRLVIIREFTRCMPFEAVAEFLQIKRDALLEFAHLVHKEFNRYVETDRRMKLCTEKRLALGLRGSYTDEEWEAPMNDMINGMDPSPAFSNSKAEVELARRFLLSFRCREEFPEHVDLAPEDQDVRDKDNFDYSCIPSFEIWKGVIDALDNSFGTMTSEVDLDMKDGINAIYFDTQRMILADERSRNLHASEGVFELIEGEEESIPEPGKVRKSPLKISSIERPFTFQAPKRGGPLLIEHKPGNQPQPHRQVQPQPKPPKKPTRPTKKKAPGPSSSGPQGVTKKKTPKAGGNKARKAENAPSRLREVMNADDVNTPGSSADQHPASAAVFTQPGPPTAAAVPPQSTDPLNPLPIKKKTTKKAPKPKAPDATKSTPGGSSAPVDQHPTPPQGTAPPLKTKKMKKVPKEKISTTFGVVQNDPTAPGLQHTSQPQSSTPRSEAQRLNGGPKPKYSAATGTAQIDPPPPGTQHPAQSQGHASVPQPQKSISAPKPKYSAATTQPGHPTPVVRPPYPPPQPPQMNAGHMYKLPDVYNQPGFAPLSFQPRPYQSPSHLRPQAHPGHDIAGVYNRPSQTTSSYQTPYQSPNPMQNQPQPKWNQGPGQNSRVTYQQSGPAGPPPGRAYQSHLHLQPQSQLGVAPVHNCPDGYSQSGQVTPPIARSHKPPPHVQSQSQLNPAPGHSHSAQPCYTPNHVRPPFPRQSPPQLPQGQRLTPPPNAHQDSMVRSMLPPGNAAPAGRPYKSPPHLQTQMNPVSGNNRSGHDPRMQNPSQLPQAQLLSTPSNNHQHSANQPPINSPSAGRPYKSPPHLQSQMIPASGRNGSPRIGHGPTYVRSPPQAKRTPHPPQLPRVQRLGEYSDTQRYSTTQPPVDPPSAERRHYRSPVHLQSQMNSVSGSNGSPRTGHGPTYDRYPPQPQRTSQVPQFPQSQRLSQPSNTPQLPQLPQGQRLSPPSNTRQYSIAQAISPPIDNRYLPPQIQQTRKRSADPEGMRVAKKQRVEGGNFGPKESAARSAGNSLFEQVQAANKSGTDPAVYDVISRLDEEQKIGKQDQK